MNQNIAEISAGLENPEAMRAASQRALKITMQLNNQYHEPAMVRKLFFELICQPEDDTFSLFPPFYTDYGKNIRVGKNVFINTGCRFQDQGGIVIGEVLLRICKVLDCNVGDIMDVINEEADDGDK